MSWVKSFCHHLDLYYKDEILDLIPKYIRKRLGCNKVRDYKNKTENRILKTLICFNNYHIGKTSKGIIVVL